MREHKKYIKQNIGKSFEEDIWRMELIMCLLEEIDNELNQR